mgnify:CR=1 FL=1
MDDTSQIQPPPSFAELFRTRSGKLSEPIGTVVARYELCEDLACHLVAQAQQLLHGAVPSEAQVLLRIYQGLCTPGSGCNASEARWITLRLAELLQWECPLLVSPDTGAAGAAPAA